MSMTKVENSVIESLDASKLTGTLPAIDGSSLTNLPAAPAAQSSVAQATLSGDIGISSHVTTIINWTSEAFDTDTMHDISTNNSRLTAKTAGKYLVQGNINWGNNNTGARQYTINKNGVGLWVLTNSNNVAGQDQGSSFLTVDLAVNEYVEFSVWHGSGAVLTIFASGSSFTASYLGV